MVTKKKRKKKQSVFFSKSFRVKKKMENIKNLLKQYYSEKISFTWYFFLVDKILRNSMLTNFANDIKLMIHIVILCKVFLSNAL